MDLRRAAPTRRRAVREAVRDVHPGYFSLVMATGIISVALHEHGVPELSIALMWLTGAAYLTLLGVYAWRAAAFSAEMRRDLAHPARGFGFFTVVAGSDVLGTRLSLANHDAAAVALLVVGGLGWLALGYLIPWTAALGGTDRPVVAGANGTWFNWVVATQSVAVLAAQVEPAFGPGRRELALLAVVCWSVGVFCYAAVGVLITIRLLLYQVRAADFTPPYWVAMGATAITTLAGAQAVHMADTPIVAATRPLIAGTSVIFWAFGTWLIPPLVAAGWWRHVTHRIPLTYEPGAWSIVFPLGMYGVASRALGNADHLPAVTTVGRYEIWLALAVWAVTFAAMLAHLARTLLRRPVEHG